MTPDNQTTTEGGDHTITDESRSGATKASARLLRLSRRAAGRFWWGLPLRIDEPSEQELSRRSRVGDDPEATWLTDGRGAARDVV